jgi:hypothetical protein
MSHFRLWGVNDFLSYLLALVKFIVRVLNVILLKTFELRENW